MKLPQLFICKSILFLGLFLGCASAPEVLFKDTIDTETKPISYQQKRVFTFADSGVSFSNQFEGARLNAVDQLNDSIFIVTILPENEPINHSPFYAFDLWSSSPKEITLKFKYPGEYKHRYIPKIRTNGVWSVADSLNFKFDENFSSLKLKINPTVKTVSGQELHTSSVVYSWVDKLIEGKESFVRSKTIGKTKLKRPFKVLDIYKGSPKNKSVLVLLTRQHPPEVTGYFAFQAFLSTM